jgi:hypothetical protein
LPRARPSVKDRAPNRTCAGQVTKAAGSGLPFRTVPARDIKDLRRIGQVTYGDPTHVNPGITKPLNYYRSIGML